MGVWRGVCVCMCVYVTSKIPRNATHPPKTLGTPLPQHPEMLGAGAPPTPRALWRHLPLPKHPEAVANPQ